MPTAALLIIGAYLLGAVPTAYLVARYRKGIDIRDYGSGNVGAENVFSHVGKWTGFFLGTFDCLAKGALPVVLARVLDQSVGVQAAAGVAAVAGHNWSPYIGFTGGRGIATVIGVVFGLTMWKEILVLGIFLSVGSRLILRETALVTFFSMLALPALAFLFGQPDEIVYMTLVTGTLLMLKRLTANWERPAGEYTLAQVMVNRVLWDRDVPRKIEWTSRQPRQADEKLG